MDVSDYFWTTNNDHSSWNLKDMNTLTVSKWKWLWRQFLCVLGVSKRPSVFYGIDLSKDGDFQVEVWAKINDSGDLEITNIREAP